MKIDKSSWPILLVSAEINQDNDAGFRLRELEDELIEVQHCAVITASSYEDAAELFISRADLGVILVDWDIAFEKAGEKMAPSALVKLIRSRNKTIPVLLLTDRLGTDQIPTEVLKMISGAIWKTADTIEFLAGRIEVHLNEYIAGVYPPFFGEMIKYAEEYKYAWHTPGHLGGQGFLRSPSGVALFKFFGENTMRSDLSISVPELGSLLDHEGVVGDAEKHSARVFGADQTYYVLNGTSTVNQIIWHSQLVNNDIAFVDRNCHKSLNYAMVVTEALPVYMIPRRNPRGTIGPVRLAEFSAKSIQSKVNASSIIPAAAKKACRVKMSALTNSTYDGLCYNVVTIKKQLEKSVENLHFDEAWYAYAKFHPVYKDHFGMADTPVLPDDPPIFCSQSTHKLLTAFSQASMLHIRNGGKIKIDPVEFNESYMLHGSTSPQYSMIASLDVATKMMEDNGQVMMHDIILEAIAFRRKVAAIRREFEKKGDWFFGVWQPKTVKVKGRKVDFADVDPEFLASHQEPWVLDAADPWHGFTDIEKNYVMLDPIKLTITTPGINDDGSMDKTGIPASILTNYLIKHNIVCEKTDYYSFLMLNSLGTTPAKQATLLTAMLQFKDHYDRNSPLAEVFPEMVAAYPEAYTGVGLADHCNAIHSSFKKHNLLGLMQQAFEVIPDQAFKPSDAYHEVVRRNVEYVRVNNMKNRITAVMLVPYPPGIPIAMGGEIMNAKAKPILDYLIARQDFENEFPGYEGDIHGIERDEVNGKKYFKTMCVKK